ncbi:imm11 family protein [Corallococcus llansteffanensis]|uniref:Immunity MXAN-0049 protein domain-containing protein n=1 Tax=Corallococcus llansteffanensis TaxID=2316731 RepID=A0A3A8PZE2_9BACT|nr:hypothetical protein D7V93_11130 [Corallococcus llansteffanensis]
MPSYFILQPQLHEDYAAIGNFPRSMTHIHMPATGVRMGELYKDGQEFNMDEDSTGIQISDVLHNTFGYLMVSSRLKALIEQHAKAEIEFLRFTLINHKKRVESDSCYIVNVIGGKDWVDLDKSEGQFNPAHKNRYMRVRRLVLKEDAVDPEANLFRVAAAPRLPIVREDFKALLESEQTTGAEFFEVGTPVNLMT